MLSVNLPANRACSEDRLSDAEYAYMIDKAGEDYAERAYGIDYSRGAAVGEE